MSKSKVYFTDFHVPVGTSQLEKLRRLIDRAGLGEMDLNNKFVCIKMHFGEPGNLTFLRPNYAMLWSIWTPPMKTGFPPFPPGARSLSVTG